MITLYGVTRSRAARNIWLLNELGQGYKQVPVVQANRLANPNAPDAPLHTRSAAFLAINPNGHVPSMVDGDVVLHESMAINLYLAKKYGGPLASASLAEDGLITMWTIWAITELEPHAIQIMFHRAMKPVEERVPAIADAAIVALHAPFGVLSKALEGNGFVVGGRFTVADLNLAEVVRYAAFAPELMAAFPVIKNWLAACHARPAFQAMWAQRDAEPMLEIAADSVPALRLGDSPAR
jgi:glutathione S-transferase